MSSVSEKIIVRGFKHVMDSQQKNTCVMVDDEGREVQITKAMVVSVCHQLLKQCRSIKN
ncbi:PA1571 family protein [Acinetobacter sp. WZC-1]|uniref:PA1571 family protein n=1 Tax=Acinetobacter sp. WZC-1 TaxID=3459034 RepID=UPI00403D7FA5